MYNVHSVQERTVWKTVSHNAVHLSFPLQCDKWMDMSLFFLWKSPWFIILLDQPHKYLIPKSHLFIYLIILNNCIK